MAVAQSAAAVAAATPLGLSGTSLVLLVIIVLLFASLAKGSGMLSPAFHGRIDRAVGFVCGSALLIFFAERATLAAATGSLSITSFFKYFIAGGICAFVTHAMCTPIDVVKTRIQTTSGKYRGMAHCFRTIVADEGPSALLKGLGATASGYFLHGAFKYSFYEVFKTLLSADNAAALKPPFHVAALGGFLAECIACLLLCPMEAVRIRSVTDAGFPTGVMSGLRTILGMEGLHGLYKGLPAMLLKQVPYTVGQFVSFELSLNAVKSVVLAMWGATSATEIPRLAVGLISLSAGLLAGIAAGVISHPGDTILSKINQERSEGSAWLQIVRVARTEGPIGLFVGLAPRLVQVSCMIGGQFLIYDSIKLLCGIQPAAALAASVASSARGTHHAPLKAINAAHTANALAAKSQ